MDSNAVDLFVINRFVGEEKNEEAPDESKLRRDLLKKAKERKRLIESEAICKQIADETLVNGHQNEETVVQPEEPDVPPKKKTKKKKKKDSEEKSQNETESTENQINTLDVSLETGETDNKTHKAFPILGVDTISQTGKVKRSIPNWLANPSVVSVDLKNLQVPVDSLSGLDEVFVSKLKQNGITHFFPVQTQIIPWLLESSKKPSFYWPNDICVSAPTGSGKTLAFVLPILQDLRKRIVPKIQAVVVLPVQDLAAQVFKVFQMYAQPTDLKVLLLSRKRPFVEEQNLLRKEDPLCGVTNLVDIIVTTPGRLVDHLMNTNGFSLKHVKYLVIDEADRIMEDMQNDWLYHLNKKILADSSKSYQTPILTYNTLLSKQRLPQKLLFSATLSQDPEKLQQLGLFQPKLFTSVVASDTNGTGSGSKEEPVNRFLGKYTTPAELEEFYAIATKATKPLTVHHLIKTKNWRRVLCFVNSVDVTERLSFLLRKLNPSLKIRSISAKISPVQRDNLIKSFANGYIDVLISSDALARGIDIPNAKYVISYSLPKYLKTYIHRIGRTGRAGKEGVSLILLAEKEVCQFQEMVKSAGKKSVKHIPVDEAEIEQYSEAYQEALDKLKLHLEKEKEKTLSSIKSSKSKNKKINKRKHTKKIKKNVKT